MAGDLAQGGVKLGDTGLEVQLPKHGMSYFNYYWLRDNCSTSFDPQTRERDFDIFRLKSPPRPQGVRIVDQALEIVWAGENHTSLYPVEWLEDRARGARPDPADLPRKAWYGDHYPAITRAPFARLHEDKAALSSFLRALIVEGIAIATDMPDSDQALTDLVKLFGHVRPTFWGENFHVRTHIAPTNLAYTAKALELHTDTPAEDYAPGMQLLHCRANSVEGGDNLFLDGVAVAEDLRIEAPEDFRILCENTVPFFCEHDTFDMRAHQRVIELDTKGAVSGVTFSQHLADAFDMPQRDLDRFYPAFCRFGQMFQREKYLMRFNIRAGECLVFDNHRVVHGRDAYSATSGDRHLHGCYADRGEVRSTYRVLVGQGFK